VNVTTNSRLVFVFLFSVLCASCASTDESLEPYLEPPTPLAGLTEVNALYRAEEVFMTRLHENWQRHMGRRTDTYFPAHNEACAKYLAKEIQEFTWTGYASAFEADKKRIMLHISQHHCDELIPEYVAEDSTEKQEKMPTLEEAKAYQSVDDFIAGVIATDYTPREKKKLGWQQLRENDIYLYRAFVPGKDMLRGLLWPRLALHTYCTAQGGTLEEELYVDGYLLVKRTRTAKESSGLTTAVENKAYGKKFCVDKGVVRWGVFVGPGRMTSKLPTNLQESHLPLEQRTYTSEMTLHINTGMYRDQQGLPFKPTVTGRR